MMGSCLSVNPSINCHCNVSTSATLLQKICSLSRVVFVLEPRSDICLSDEYSSLQPIKRYFSCFRVVSLIVFGSSCSNKSSGVAEMGGATAGPQQTWAEKWGGGCCAAFRRGRAGSPCNTTSPGPRPTSLPSGILIHPTVSPQYTNVTHRQDRPTG